MRGRLEVIYGCMFSGKTEELIRRVKIYENGLDFRVHAFKSILDDRYNRDYICSHSGARIPASSVEDVRGIRSILSTNMEVCVVDEVQFFDDKLMELILNLRNDGKIIITSGLNQDFRGEVFRFKGSERNIGELIALADDSIHLTAICKYREDGGLNRCEARATRTQRLVDGLPASYYDDIIKVGGGKPKDRDDKSKPSVTYEARCPRHHFVRGK